MELSETILALLRDPYNFSENSEQIKLFQLYDIKERSKNNKRVMIIPCAGHSSRMGLNFPKSLYPILGVPCLLTTLLKFSNYCSNFYIPINTGSLELFQKEICGNEHFLQNNIKINFIEVIPGFGDGDAILEALFRIKDEDYNDLLITWGDAYFNGDLIINTSLNLQQLLQNKIFMIIPTVFEENPYVALLRDSNGKICDVKFRRRGEFENNKEHDLSFFVGNISKIKKYLIEFSLTLKSSEKGYKTANGELNFLDLVKFIYQNKGDEVVSPCFKENDLVLSFNTVEEANELQRRIIGKA